MAQEQGSADHVRRNRAAWDAWAPEYAAVGRRAWGKEPEWGNWDLPEAQLRLLPEVAGRDVVELGCGTAYISAWLARRGARVVGIDNSRAQLATARALQGEFGLRFPLLHADAERVPLADARFDLAISEYGACLWADPYQWVPEAARLLRPGGDLIFLTPGVILALCSPEDPDTLVGDSLLRGYFGLYRIDWSDNHSAEFHLGYGDWIRLLRGSGFEVLDLRELRPDAAATTRSPYIPLEWARRWPSEQVWSARKRR